ncbi:MAG TPA: serine/threonine-protein kinase [Candidatus Limnocylindrales bacterium]|nr:serine/threonine-protein kinase [Candidatus Limnocylindrales bacterium]
MASSDQPTVVNVTPRATTPASAPADSSASRKPLSQTSSSRAGSQGQYVAGTTLADRYRIVALLGKGGMGEVYRAEDLRLTQTVALKFLPDAMLQDESARERFHQEVRLAREIAHPNVCRVFDIGETDGRLFLTMEYVDGEDLASLLRRIGQLPQSKGLDIARQLCAGLAAAHDHGVLHRDLKPGNIMLDGRGRVRVTDFGLAALGENLVGEELRAGTPAYMAPEQLAGTGVSARSDIYSLGLVLYEIFTGKKAFEAASLPDLIRLREHSSPTSISSIVRDIDPLVERVILRCLEKDPAKRPATALQVAAALPGGDPLAAALAAGETPSPEMVAAAGETEGIRPWIAWTCLLLILGGLAAGAFLSDKATVIGIVPLPLSTEVLAQKARDMTRQIGYPAPPVDTSYGFGNWSSYPAYVRHHDQSVTRWRNLASGSPPVLVFWYRESPRYMNVQTFQFAPLAEPDDPPNRISGACQLYLDTFGRLIGLECVPPQFISSTDPAPPVNWAPVFAAAGMDMNAFRSVPPQWTELVEADTRAAWEGHWPDHPDIPLRIETGAFRGVPVYFDTISPWDKPSRLQEGKSSSSDMAQIAVLVVCLIAILTFGAILAARNLKANRADRSGAFRLALGVLLVMSASAMLFAHHVPGAGELNVFWICVGWGLIFGALVWLVYIALEPHVRRRWPNALISWSRLLSGRFRDPLVGRDFLIGILLGVLWNAANRIAVLAPGWMGKPPLEPQRALDVMEFNGIRIVAADLMLNVILFVLGALAFFFLLFLFRLLLRREWLAGAAATILIAIPSVFSEHPWLNVTATVIFFGIAIAVLIRFGFLSLLVGLTLNNVLEAYPVTAHWSAWYAQPTIFVFSLLAALAVFSFYASLGGKPVFGAVSID